MIKIERSFPAPASLEIESKKVSGSYSKPDVIKQLRQDFYDTILKNFWRNNHHFADLFNAALFDGKQTACIQ